MSAGGLRECKPAVITSKRRHEEMVKKIKGSIGASMKKGTPIMANGAWYAVRFRSKAIWWELDNKKPSMVESIVKT